jgi:hypothetical protein
VLLRQVAHGVAPALGRPPTQVLGELRAWLGSEDPTASPA